MKDLYEASEKAKEPVTDAVFMFNMGGLAWKHMGTTTGLYILNYKIENRKKMKKNIYKYVKYRDI